ncbi:MAG: formylglycine-generating enzyme family protein [Spirochaetaceae bacterium]|jgi:formylglycine-generating enzyme required for sulfatase activity|nr:formylglycine-generating enzyme family protein [Spirochaetaceae bacterium]
MEKNFQDLIQQILREQGEAILEHPVQCRGLMSDYAKGRYKREIRLFLLALESGGYQAIQGSKNLAADMPRFCRVLAEAQAIPLAEAEEALGMLAEIFHSPEDDETALAIETLEKSARKGDYRAMYDLGLLLEKLTWYEESNYWFKKAAKQGLLLFERRLLSLENSPKSEERIEKAEETAKGEEKAEEKSEKTAKSEKTGPEKFVKIPKGTFLMGSSSKDSGWRAEETQHQVQISGFYLGKYPVTQGEYQALTGTNPSLFSGEHLPVEQVTWFEAAGYCNARSFREGLTPAYILHRDRAVWDRTADGYRLPTEAEWEYACRAGTTSAFHTGRRIRPDQANYNGSADAPPGTYRRRTTPVGSFPPNPWGLYDMHGNVYEWCWDWYGEYSITVQRDPAGPVSGENRVIRGGSWNYPARHLRSAARSYDAPERRSPSVGFRLLRPCIIY